LFGVATPLVRVQIIVASRLAVLPLPKCIHVLHITWARQFINGAPGDTADEAMYATLLILVLCCRSISRNTTPSAVTKAC
jgi:hypothetical protein